MKKLSKPLISVLLSTYNDLPYLKESVESILNQSYKNFELILIDDGSNLKTKKYLKTLKDKRIKLITNKSNLGLTNSLNIGLKAVLGNYVARMDADDISLPKRLESQLMFMINNPSVDISGSWAKLIDKNGKEIGVKKNPLSNKAIKRSLDIYPSIIHPTFFAKIEFFKKLHGYRAEFDGAEEYDLLIRAKRKFTMANLAEPLIKWRLSDTRRSIKMIGKMHELDKKIKLNSLKINGINLIALYGIIRLTALSFIPIPIKIKIARFLKIA